MVAGMPALFGPRRTGQSGNVTGIGTLDGGTQAGCERNANAECVR